ncbi:MAG: hypothetical protein ACP5PB_09225 [Acidimicrobiales bacterium]
MTSRALPAAAAAVSSPLSVSLLASREGWLLSTYHCTTQTCTRLERTTDAGRTWTTLRLPTPLQRLMRASNGYYPTPQMSVYFATSSDGWIYGSTSPTSGSGTTTAVLWATRDGGRTWSPAPIASPAMKFGVLTVSASRGYVYAIAWISNQGFGLWRSPLAHEDWRRVSTPRLEVAAGGTSMEGALVFKGASGWLMVGNDRGVTGGARLTGTGRWVAWRGPCATVGGDFDVPVAYSATSLLDVCTIGGFGGDVTPGTPRRLTMATSWIFTSNDGGLTFTPARQIGVGIATMWITQVPGLPASPVPGVILVAKPINQGSSSIEHLFATRNGGKTWASVYSPPSASSAILVVTFASSRLGAAIVQIAPSRSFLIISSDGGRTWHRANT